MKDFEEISVLMRIFKLKLTNFFEIVHGFSIE
jgi:hypothetical protein